MLTPVTRQTLLGFRKEVDEKKESARREQIQKGVALIYERARDVMKYSPHRTNWSVLINDFSLDTRYQGDYIMRDILNEVQMLFPDFSVMESTTTSYEFTFILRDSK